MSAPPPLLTIVIPTRNRRNLAEDALKSAVLPLPFTYEILLSDNASTDSTPELPGLFPGITYIRRSETLGMAEHWNICVKESRGKYIKLLCDDDWLIPGALAREVAELESDSSLMLCASPRLEIADDREPVLKRYSDQLLRIYPTDTFWRMIRDENFIGPPSAVTFRKNGFGGFPSQYGYAADWAAWLLLAERGPIFLHTEPGVNFRLHSGNLTNAAVENGVDFVEVQALRREAVKRLGGLWEVLGWTLWGAIFCYRFTRRTARYFVRGNLKGFGKFILRVFAGGPEKLPLL